MEKPIGINGIERIFFQLIMINCFAEMVACGVKSRGPFPIKNTKEIYT